MIQRLHTAEMQDYKRCYTLKHTCFHITDVTGIASSLARLEGRARQKRRRQKAIHPHLLPQTIIPGIDRSLNHARHSGTSAARERHSHENIPTDIV